MCSFIVNNFTKKKKKRRILLIIIDCIFIMTLMKTKNLIYQINFHACFLKPAEQIGLRLLEE